MTFDRRDDTTNLFWKPWDYHCHLDTDCTNSVNWYNSKISEQTSTNLDYMNPGGYIVGEYDGLVPLTLREAISTWTDHRSTSADNYDIWSDKTRT